MRTFAETFYNLNEGEIGGSTPANRTGENIACYHEPPGPVPRKKRVRVRSPGKQPAVSIKAPTKQERVRFAEEQMAVVQIQDPRSSKWLTMQSVQADPQIWTPLMHYLKSVHKKRIRVVDNKGQLLDVLG